MTDNAKNYHEKMFPGYVSDFLRTDPEFIEAFDNFAFDEVVNQDDLDDKTRFISILAVLLGCQGIDEFKGMLKAAYNFGVTPVEMKEIVYQAVGLKLPLENQNDPNTSRLEKGEQAQVAIFGEEMRGYATSGDPKTMHIRKWLTDNCFGDYYTRGGLDYKQREMITFCFLYAQGGCKPQAIAHAKANIRLGNDEAFLIKVVSQNVPFVGYPRSLNAIDCIEKAGKE